ncbi:MAG TPA: hypothetical protein VGR73_15710 [Bryobacteraceae bacterium]|nr:hypothetical protein [Bryobacteraceae bacterium]
MNLRRIFLLLPLLGALCLADDAADRTKLVGAWELDNGGGKTSWILEKTSDGLHFTYMHGAEKLADFQCSTSGHECEVQIAGKGCKVSLYYSGPSLMMLETRGDTVVQRKFQTAAGGKEIDVATASIVPEGKPEILRLKKAPLQASGR